MKGKPVQFFLRAVASLAWAIAGISKLVAPASAKVADVEIGVPVTLLIGALEIGLASAWWIPLSRRGVAHLSLWLASLFAILMITGLVDPKTCACFGRLQVEKARHLVVLATMIVVSAAMILLDQRRTIPHPGLVEDA